MNELISKAKNGNKEAFTELIIGIEDDLYKIARIRLSNKEDILDAIQETMLSAYKSIHKLKKDKYFKTWVIKILINKCNDIYKQKSFIELNDNIKNCDDLNKSNIIAEDNLNFEFIIRKLDYDERIVMILYYLEEYSTKEIGKMLNINENTIKTRIHRAKEKLKKEYKGEVKE